MEESQQQALDGLIKCLLAKPCLHSPDCKLLYVLRMDASGIDVEAVAAVLLKEFWKRAPHGRICLQPAISMQTKIQYNWTRTADNNFWSLALRTISFQENKINCNQSWASTVSEISDREVSRISRWSLLIYHIDLLSSCLPCQQNISIDMMRRLTVTSVKCAYGKQTKLVCLMK